MTLAKQMQKLEERVWEVAREQIEINHSKVESGDLSGVVRFQTAKIVGNEFGVNDRGHPEWLMVIVNDIVDTMV